MTGVFVLVRPCGKRAIEAEGHTTRARGRIDGGAPGREKKRRLRQRGEEHGRTQSNRARAGEVERESKVIACLVRYDRFEIWESESGAIVGRASPIGCS